MSIPSIHLYPSNKGLIGDLLILRKEIILKKRRREEEEERWKALGQQASYLKHKVEENWKKIQKISAKRLP